MSWHKHSPETCQDCESLCETQKESERKLNKAKETISFLTEREKYLTLERDGRIHTQKVMEAKIEGMETVLKALNIHINPKKK